MKKFNIKNHLNIISNALTDGHVAARIENASNAYCYEQNSEHFDRVRIITIPNSDFSEKKNVDIANGQLIHESLHVIFSDCRAFALAKRQLNSFAFKLFTNFEDAYVEAKGADKWRGCSKFLERRLIAALDIGMYPDPESLPIETLIDNYCALYVFYNRNLRPISNLFKSYSEEVASVLVDKKGLDKLLSQACNTPRSLQNLQKAEQVYEFLKNTFKDQQSQQPQQDQSNQQGESSDDKGESGESNQQGESSDDKGESGESNQQGESSDDKGDSGESNQQGESSNYKGGSDSENESSSSESNGGQHNNRADQQVDFENTNVEQDATKQLYKELIDKSYDCPDVPCLRTLPFAVKNSHTGIGGNIIRSAKNLQPKLMRCLKQVIKAQTFKNVSFSRKGSIDTSRLNRAITDGKAMKTQSITTGEKAVVSLLVDSSGSMRALVNSESTRMQSAEITMLALARSFERLDVPCEAIRYSNDEVKVYKLFTEKAATASLRVGFGPTGNTPTGEAVLTLASRLSKQPELNKIMYVITDGATSTGYNHLQSSCDIASDMGIRVIFIYIGKSEKFSIQGTDTIAVQDVEELPKVLNKLTMKLL